jgi:hypothetical protein
MLPRSAKTAAAQAASAGEKMRIAAAWHPPLYAWDLHLTLFCLLLLLLAPLQLQTYIAAAPWWTTINFYHIQ